MDYKRLSKGLGLFSIALGAAELLAARRIARSVSAEGHERLIRGFGARELTAGTGLLLAPAHSTRMWGRVAGDAMDLGALGLSLRKAPRSKAAMGAFAFVVGATVLDVLVAMGLDRTTGKAAPTRTEPEIAPNAEETRALDTQAPDASPEGTGATGQAADAPNERGNWPPPPPGDATSIEPAHVAHPQPPHVVTPPDLQGGQP